MVRRKLSWVWRPSCLVGGAIEFSDDWYQCAWCAHKSYHYEQYEWHFNCYYEWDCKCVGYYLKCILTKPLLDGNMYQYIPLEYRPIRWE